MITVEKIDEVHLRVYADDPSIEQELSDFFTFEYPGARFTPQYRARLWDGKVRLYDIIRKTLPVGLIQYVIDFSDRNNYQIEFKGEENILARENTTYKEVEEFAKWLNPHGHGKPIEIRDYQIEAVRHALDHKRTLLLSPTASGKSFIIYTTMRWHLDKGRKCVIIVPTTSLVEQLYADFEDYSSANGWKTSYHCQKLYSGFTKDFSKDVLITTWQSIYKQPKAWFNQFDVVIGDEAHLFKAKSLTKIMEKMLTCKYRFGFTGTLDGTETNKLVLEGLFGQVKTVAKTTDLIEKKYLADLKIKIILMKYSDDIRKQCKNFDYATEMDFLVRNEKRNRFIKNLALSLKGNTLLLFQYVEKHGKELYKSVLDSAKDRKVFFVYGGVEADEREEIRKLVENEKDAIIVASSGVFSTGVNIKNIHNIIFSSPSKSKIRTLQSIGRGLRTSKTKESVTLFDIADDLSWKTRKNFTLEHFKERARIYAEEGFDYKVYKVDL